MFNQNFSTRPSLIDLNTDEQRYYSFVLSFDRHDGSCNTVDGLYEIIFDMSDRLCVPNKTENVNVEVVSMISRNNELKLTVKSTSCDFRYRFDL